MSYKLKSLEETTKKKDIIFPENIAEEAACNFIHKIPPPIVSPMLI